MIKTIRTDLAAEAFDFYFEAAKEEDKENRKIDGIKTEIENFENDITLTRVIIEDERGEAAIGKKKGRYITIEFPKDFFGYNSLSKRLIEICSEEIKKLMGNKHPKTTLVIGLGNRNITADAIGPKTVEGVLATRHLIKYMPDEIDRRLSSVAAAAPGVLGITGIETGEMVFGICEKLKPDLIIAIDALCSRKTERINSTVQISNTGIVPGAGVGNARAAICEETLNTPVIALGIPTVVDAATIAKDTFEIILENLSKNARDNLPLYKILNVLKQEDNESLIKNALSPSADSLIVTPKEIDETVIRLSKILSDGINLALHNGLSLSELELFKY